MNAGNIPGLELYSHHTRNLTWVLSFIGWDLAKDFSGKLQAGFDSQPLPCRPDTDGSEFSALLKPRLASHGPTQGNLDPPAKIRDGSP